MMLEIDKEYRGWSRERVSRHVLYWGFWLTFYCLLNGSMYSNYLQWLLFELMAMIAKLPYVYFVIYFLFPRFIPDKKYLKFGLSMVLTAVAASIITAFLYEYFPYPMGKDLQMSLGKYIYRVLDLLYIASFVVVIKLVQQYAIQQKTNILLMQEKVGSELQLLRNQLQPHFLFNTLNNIYSLVISNDKQAAGAILKLSDILSYMLYDCNVEKISLEKEIQLIRNYIELEKIRYGSRIEVSFSVEGEISNHTIPPLVLIPFVENAFKHGIGKSEKSSWIRIYINLAENELFMEVENPVSANENINPKIKSGIGIRNLIQRLNLMYGNRYTIQISETETYLVNLKLPL